MKQAVLRAAVHNALDSLTSGCPLAFAIGDYHFPFWMLVGNLPEKVFEADILTGRVTTQGSLKGMNSYRQLVEAMASMAEQMPGFLHRHGCPPKLVESIAVRFESDRSHRHWVTATIVRTNGASTTDVYFGTPLKRRRSLDRLGRVRRV